jgi:hypothetical protein
MAKMKSQSIKERDEMLSIWDDGKVFIMYQA